MLPRLVALALVWTAVASCGFATAEAAIIYVDNRIGRDGLDGSTPRPVDRNAGPVRSLRRAAELCTGLDTIVLANNPGSPYYGSLQLFGSRHSGLPEASLQIIGNGAVVSGLRAVPPTAWRPRANDVWELHTYRKGHVLLVHDGQPVPRHPCDKNARTLPEIPEGHFCVFRGHTFYHAPPTVTPPEENFAFGFEDVGITLYKVHDVAVHDLVLRHFRLDGVNAADSAERITLENVTVQGCGRAGVAAFGASDVTLRGCTISGNREHSVLVSDPAAVVVEESELDAEPAVRE